jgi:hypothetical protein
MRATVILTPVFLSCLLQVAIGADLRISEIRFESITGYGHEHFTLKIRSDGCVEYVGKDFVAVKGKQRSTISLDDFKRLVKKIEQIGFSDRSIDTTVFHWTSLRNLAGIKPPPK